MFAKAIPYHLFYLIYLSLINIFDKRKRCGVITERNEKELWRFIY